RENLSTLRQVVVESIVVAQSRVPCMLLIVSGKVAGPGPARRMKGIPTPALGTPLVGFCPMSHHLGPRRHETGGDSAPYNRPRESVTGVESSGTAAGQGKEEPCSRSKPQPPGRSRRAPVGITATPPTTAGPSSPQAGPGGRSPPSAPTRATASTSSAAVTTRS